MYYYEVGHFDGLLVPNLNFDILRCIYFSLVANYCSCKINTLHRDRARFLVSCILSMKKSSSHKSRPNDENGAREKKLFFPYLETH